MSVIDKHGLLECFIGYKKSWSIGIVLYVVTCIALKIKIVSPIDPGIESKWVVDYRFFMFL